MGFRLRKVRDYTITIICRCSEFFRTRDSTSSTPDWPKLYVIPFLSHRRRQEVTMSLYQRIHGDLWRNIWVVGDLHGCYTLLMQHLNRVAFQPMQDLLISVGDLIDRGSEDVECLMMLNQP